MYETNLKDVERVLLAKSGLRTVCRFMVRGAYDHVYPDLASQMKRIYASCPSLFDKILARSDVRALVDEADMEDEMPVNVSGAGVSAQHDDMHNDPTIGNRIPSNRVTAITHAINDGEGLPVKPANFKLGGIFSRELRAAYLRDYNVQGFISFPRTKPLQWAKNFRFTDR